MIMNNRRYCVKYYYSLREIWESVTDSSFKPFQSDEINVYGFTYSILGYDSSRLLEDADIPVNELKNGGLLQKLWSLILMRYGKHPILKLNNEIPIAQNEDEEVYYDFTYPNNEWGEALADWIINLMQLMIQTYPKYKIQYDLYNQYKSHLMDKLKTSFNTSNSSSGTSDTSNSGESHNTEIRKINDTPQASNTGFEDDNYVSKIEQLRSDNNNEDESHSSSSNSGITSGTTENDTMTIMAKLNEIQNNYQNILSKWVKEFDSLFLEEF